jgi:ubiquinone/menaquinone biosynthesis C-methylase UbiE
MPHAHERMFHHADAERLDAPERRTWLDPGDVVGRLGVGPGMRVADIGAGTGYFAIPLAERVAPGGLINAVDLQPEMLARLRSKISKPLPIELVEGSAEKTTLAGGAHDLVLLANVWHEVDDRIAAIAEVERILKDGGRLAIVDWRQDLAPPPGPPAEHRLAPAAVAGELGARGWREIGVTTVGLYSYLLTAAAPPRA